MPFTIKVVKSKVGTRRIRKRGYKVVNTNTGKQFSKRPLSKAMATRQLRALYRNVKS